MTDVDLKAEHVEAARKALSGLTNINEHLGYPFTQPLSIATYEVAEAIADAEEQAYEKAAQAHKEAAEFAVMTIEHAIHLGYLGEGSTRGMALEAVDKLKRALSVSGGEAV